MTAKYNWSVIITKKLISEYKKNEFLYNSRHPDYKNRNKRQKKYHDILNTINFIQKGLTIKDLKRKINGLRSQYLNEKFKIARSRQSRAGTETVYQPTAYWFPLLRFLDIASISNFKIEENSSYSNLGESAIMDLVPNEATILEIGSGNKQAEKKQERKRNISVLTEAANFANHQPQNKQRKRNQPNDYDNSLTLTKTTEFMSKMAKLATVPVESGDDCDVFGKFVAQEMREIRAASDQIVYRQVKRQIQLCLMNTLDLIDSKPRGNTDLSFTPDSNDFVENSSIFDDRIKVE